MTNQHFNLRKVFTWIAFVTIWFFWISNCLSTFLAFEIILSINGGGLVGNRNVNIVGYKFPVKHLLSSVFAGLIEIGSMGVTFLLLDKRKNGQNSQQSQGQQTQGQITLKNQVVPYAKVLFTIAQALAFATALSLVFFSASYNNDARNFNSYKYSSPKQDLLTTSSNVLTIGLIIFVSSAGAIIVTWITPEWALKVTDQLLTIYDESNSSN